MYQWVLFDWDGCIADSLDDWVVVCQRALGMQGINASLDAIWPKYCIGDIPKQFAVDDYMGCKRDIGIIAEDAFRGASLYEGAAHMLAELSKSKSLALVTNNRPNVIRHCLQRHDLWQYFDLIITQKTSPQLKPHPGGIRKALDFLGADPRKTVMVGDTEKDIQAARRAGVDSILFYPDSHQHRYKLDVLMKEQPTHVVNTHDELTSLLTAKS